jgi:hypothetical protein
MVPLVVLFGIVGKPSMDRGAPNTRTSPICSKVDSHTTLEKTYIGSLFIKERCSKNPIHE